jgi:hypothetical protein
MIDDGEWHWLEREGTGDYDHLIMADSLPILLPPGAHYLEGWSEAVCGGAWGPRLRGPGERLRRFLDLEHWPAFSDSFHKLVRLITEVATGRRGPAPATVVLLGGDVHHAYLAEAGLPGEVGERSAIFQAVCSPFRNALDRHERIIMRSAARRPVVRMLRLLARAAGVPDPEIRWRLQQPPTFDNQFATLELAGRRADLCIEKIVPGDWRRPRIEKSLERKLSG